MSTDRWKLIAGVCIALATTAAITAVVTYNWTTSMPPKPTSSPGSIAPPSGEPTSSETREPDEHAASPQIYDLPDHGGRLVSQTDGDRFGLPRIEADYSIDIRGDLATVIVEQSFKNPLDRDIDTAYEFPLAPDAAVYSMTMTIGDRTIEGVVKRKKQARKEYEAAKKAGKQAALLEQDRPNLFTQRIANVEAGQRVDITLRYTHTVPKSQGAYHLTIPFAVPERYTPGDMSDNKLVDGAGSDDPGAEQGGLPGDDDAGPDSVSASVRLDGGMPISKVASSSHRIRVDRYSDSDAWIELATDKDATNRHFNLTYRLSRDDTQIGAHSFWDKESDRGYFDLLIEPPSEVAASTVPKREMVYVVDHSGSMRGRRLETAKKIVADSIDRLRPVDKMRLVDFNNSASTLWSRAADVTPSSIEAFKNYTRTLRATGGTNMPDAIRQALEPETPDGYTRLVTLVTDVKVSNEFEVIELVREHLDDARVLTLGVGPDANTYLLDSLARAGRGFSRQVQLDQDTDTIARETIHRFARPILTDISVDWGELDPSGVTPEPIPDVFSGRSVRLHGRYDQPGQYTIRVNATLAGEPTTFEKQVYFTKHTHSGEAVKLAWARQQIDDHMLQLNTPEKLRRPERSDTQLKEQITKLGLRYDLATQWTSFLAVSDEEVIQRDDVPVEELFEGREFHNRMDRNLQKKRMKKSKPNQPNAAPPPKMHGSPPTGLGSIDSGDSAAGRGAGINLFKDKANSDADRDETAPRATVDYTIENADDSISKKDLKKVIDTKKTSITYCYEKELVDDPKLTGDATINMTIAPDASITNTKIVSSSISQPVADCTKRVLARITLPNSATASDTTTRATLHFTFSTDT